MAPPFEPAIDDQLSIQRRNRLIAECGWLSQHLESLRAGEALRTANDNLAAYRDLVSDSARLARLPHRTVEELLADYRRPHRNLDEALGRMLEVPGDEDFEGPFQRGRRTARNSSTIDGSKCRACLEDVPTGKRIYVNCGCTYCRECLNSAVRAGLANKMSFPPKCHVEIDVHSMGAFLDAEVLQQYNAVEEEFRSKQALYCSNTHCAKFIPKQSIDTAAGALVCCTCCGDKTCTKCRSAESVHEAGSKKCPDDLDLAKMKDLVTKRKWSRCPTCKNVVEKIEGCDHMM